MNLIKKNIVTSLSLFLLLSSGYIKSSIETKNKNKTMAYNFFARFKPGDSFYGKNISLLNSSVCQDRIFYMRHTLDFGLGAIFGLDKPSPSAQLKFTLRNKAVWGSPNIVPTTTDSTKLLEKVGQAHKHHTPRHVSWLREAWLQFSLNEAARSSFLNKEQTFTLGAFPFELGRGISLGDAYAVGPDYVGFYSDAAVDQYAFGAKLSGEITKERLSYDIYGAILNNKTGSLRDTGEKIFAQQYGRLDCPSRGFGVVNIVIAGRLNITAVNNKKNGLLQFEPYCLVNTDREQKVEFRGDATSKLGTLGLACEYEKENFGFGFDCAVNLGHQCVKGWDRNVVASQNRNGKLSFVNSHAYVGVDPSSTEANEVNLSAYKAPKAVIVNNVNQTNIPGQGISNVGTDAQSIINKATRDGNFNGKAIGTVTDYASSTGAPEQVPTINGVPTDIKDVIYNACDRFRDPYTNKYRGYMFVTDAAWFFFERDLRLAATVGYASGDADPNFLQKDGDYKGFIGLQSLYAGKRVKSSFYLGGAGKLRLPLDTPTTEEKIDKFAATVSGFSDLAFIGVGLKWEPHEAIRPFLLNPNVLLYWETWPDRKFDAKTKTLLREQSSSFLGGELNVFMEKEILKNLNFIVISSIFIPGQHFYDVQGKPLNKEQLKLLDKLDRTGYNNDSIPNLGTDVAFALNIKFDYKF